MSTALWRRSAISESAIFYEELHLFILVFLFISPNAFQSQKHLFCQNEKWALWFLPACEIQGCTRQQQSETTLERKWVRGRWVDCVIKSNYVAAVSFNTAHSRLILQISLPFTLSLWGMGTLYRKEDEHQGSLHCCFQCFSWVGFKNNTGVQASLSKQDWKQTLWKGVQFSYRWEMRAQSWRTLFLNTPDLVNIN